MLNFHFLAQISCLSKRNKYQFANEYNIFSKKKKRFSSVCVEHFLSIGRDDEIVFFFVFEVFVFFLCVGEGVWGVGEILIFY